MPVCRVSKCPIPERVLPSGVLISYQRICLAPVRAEVWEGNGLSFRMLTHVQLLSILDVADVKEAVHLVLL